MQQIVSLDLWKRIAILGKHGPRLAAIAYVTSDKNVKFGTGDLLVVDASDQAIKSGVTSAKVLGAALLRGTDIISVSGLHAKVMVLGEVGVIGSANMSDSSAEQLVEAALITDRQSIVAGIKSVIYQLAEQGEEVDREFIKRISVIEVLKRGKLAGGQRSRALHLENSDGKTWVVGVHQMSDTAHSNEQDVAEEGKLEARKHRTWRNSTISWIRWTGDSRFRSEAKEGDLVIQIWKPLGRHAVEVFGHSTILRRQEEGMKRVRFYIEESAKSHANTLALRAFQKLLKTHGFRGKVGTSSARNISATLSDALKENWNS